MRHAWSALLLACVCAAAEDTHYDVLGVKRDVSPATLKKAYYGLARSLHPDKVTDPVAKAEAELQFKRVADAYSILSDETTRKAYDYEISSPRHQQRDVEEKQRMRKQTAGQASPLDGVREVVSSLDELADLTEGKAGKLTRHVLIALHDTREAACVEQMRNINFPEPFIGMSQEWHGVKWSDIIVVARHNVGPSLASGRPSTVLSAYEKEVGPATRGTRGVRMPRCPTIIFQSRGERLGRGAAHGDSPSSDTAFYTWVFNFLQVPLTIRSEYPSKVRINWIHGSEVKELFVLAPQGSVERMVYLSHTLHAERIDRKGTHISDNTSLLIFRVTNRSEMVVRPKACLDLTADCDEWKRKGECQSNAQYMKAECSLSCGTCSETGPSAKKGGAAAAAKKGGAAAAAATTAAKVARPDEKLCVDDHLECVAWALQGDCKSNRRYMHENCKRSCGLCGSCFDNATTCALWKANGECETNAAYMRTACAFSCGFCDGVAGGGTADADAAPCVDDLSDCLLWAASGECKSNEEYMGAHCRRACGKCGTGECEDDKDKKAHCALWASQGECIQNARFMSKTCRRSCGLCGDGASGEVAASSMCEDAHKRDGECGRWASAGNCETNKAWMHEHCKRSCGLCDCADLAPKGCIDWKIDQQCTRNRRFMVKHCFKSCGWCGKLEVDAGKDACYNEDIKCETWVKDGECSRNPDFMKQECMKACGLCTTSPPPPVTEKVPRRGEAPPAAPSGRPAAKPAPVQPAAAKPAAAKPAAAKPAAAKPAAATSQPTPASAAVLDKAACADKDHRCDAWAGAGHCEQKFMVQTCPTSCKSPDCTAPAAPEVACEDKLSTDCPVLARSNEACETGFMKENCALSCGRCGKRPAPSQRARGKEEL